MSDVRTGNIGDPDDNLWAVELPFMSQMFNAWDLGGSNAPAPEFCSLTNHPKCFFRFAKPELKI